jgi:hypothetical protein
LGGSFVGLREATVVGRNGGGEDRTLVFGFVDTCERYFFYFFVITRLLNKLPLIYYQILSSLEEVEGYLVSWQRKLLFAELDSFLTFFTYFYTSTLHLSTFANTRYLRLTTYSHLEALVEFALQLFEYRTHLNNC